MLSPDVSSPSNIPSSSLEGNARPSTPLLARLLCIQDQGQHQRRRALVTLSQGAQHLLKANPNAAGLVEFTNQIRHAQDWAEAERQSACAATPSETGRAAITQPANYLHPAARLVLLTWWALIVYSSWSRNLPIPADLSNGWRKLADARLSGWQQLARQPIEKLQEIAGVTPIATTTAVTAKFLEELRSIWAAISFSSPPLALEATQPPPPPQPTVNTPPATATQPPCSTVAEQRPQHDAESGPSAQEIEGHFIGWQIRQAAHLPGLDGHGLPLRWDALHPNELKHCTVHLTRLLRGGDVSARLTAGTCLLMLLAGLPLRLLAQLRFHEHGDTWIDLDGGFLLRNIGAITSRMDETSGAKKADWRRIGLPVEVANVLKRSISSSERLLSFGNCLERHGIDESDVFTLLNECDTTSHGPKLSRLSRSLGLFLLDLGVNPTLAAQISGDWGLCPLADHFYLAISEHQILHNISLACRALGLTPPAITELPRSQVGSPQYRSAAQLAAAFTRFSSALQSLRIKLPQRSRIADTIEYQNQYQLACALLFVVTTGHRGSRLQTATWSDVDLDTGLTLVRDKESDEYSARRLVPLPGVTRQTLRHLRAHQGAMVERLQKAVANGDICINAGTLDQAITTLFHRYRRHRRTGRYYLAPVAHEDLATALEPFDMPVNVGRHFGFSELVLCGCPSMAINAWTGRHLAGAEPFGLQGTLAPVEVCDHLLGTLEQVFDPLGLTPLVGLGPVRERELKQPPAAAVYRLTHPKNDYLADKLRAQDLLITPNIHVQRCPFEKETLVAARYFARLRSTFLRADLTDAEPGASLTFSMILFDLVVSSHELEALRGAVVEQPLRVKQAVFAQHSHEGVVTAFRPLSLFTQGCLLRLRGQSTSAANAGNLSADLGVLLRTLDPDLDVQRIADPISWLTTLAMHWALVHTAPTEQFAAFASTRSISAVDVARSINKQPASLLAPTATVPVRRRNRGMKDLVSYVRHFANKRMQLGETQRRKKSLARVVQALQRSLPPTSDNLHLACDWVIAECVAPTYNAIKPGTLYKYLTILSPVLAAPIPVDEFEPDDWVVTWNTLTKGRADETLSDVSGALMHLTSFLRHQGIAVPAKLLPDRQRVSSVALRQPVVVFDHEIQRAAEWIQRQTVPWRELAVAQMHLLADVGCRPIEASNLTIRDVSTDGALVHINTSGFDHLKSSGSRGSVTVLSPDLRSSLSDIARLQSRTLGKRLTAQLFAFEDADIAPNMEALIVRALRLATGVPTLTLRDLRASAVTHGVAPLPDMLTALTAGEWFEPPAYTANQLHEKSRAMALAVRRARHSTTFATTQQYYDAGAAVRLSLRLRQTEARLAISSKFMAFVTGRTAQAIDVARHREHAPVTDHRASWNFLLAQLAPLRSSIAEPKLAPKMPTLTAETPRIRAASLAWATLLRWYGLSAGDVELVTGVDNDDVGVALRAVAAGLGRPIHPDSASRRSDRRPTLLSSDRAVLCWQKLQALRQSKGGDLALIISRFNDRGFGQFPSSESSHLAAALLARCLPDTWKVFVAAPANLDLQQRSALRSQLNATGIGLVLRVSASPHRWGAHVQPATAAVVSPRTVGEISRYVFRAAAIAAFLPTERSQ
ncbi:hypothetical protein [Diaphorobacter sp. ED-3]|uniref:hypothetical protein n=1 Tax=Diaphorobacter sp. ED-3 TaxID=3016636 RepID=UPI0022DE8352|nr:hypothetical protein [Diaphorobacter sp. ED-3]